MATARAAGPGRVNLAHVAALPRPRRAAAAAALKAINAVPAAADNDDHDHDELSDDLADELSYTDAEDTPQRRSGHRGPRATGVSQTLAPGEGAATAAAVAAAGNLKSTGGAAVPAAAQGPLALAGAAAAGQDALPALTAAPVYSAGMEGAGQPSFSLAAAVAPSGPAAPPSAKLVGELSLYPDATAAVPAAAAGRNTYGEAVDSIQPISGKAAAGIQEQEGARGGAMEAAIVLEGGFQPLQPAAAAGERSDQQVCSQGIPSCWLLGESGPASVKKKWPEGALSEKGRSSSGTCVRVGLGGVSNVSKEAGRVDLLGQADDLSNGKAANSAVGREGQAETGTACTALAAVLLGGAALTAVPAAAMLLVPAAADQPAVLEKELSNGAECKAEATRSRGAGLTGMGKQQWAEATAAKDPNGGDALPLSTAPAAAEEVPLQPLPPIAKARGAAARPFPAVGMVHVADPQMPSVSTIPPPAAAASVHGDGGLALLAPLAVKVEPDRDLRSKVAVAAAPTAAGGPPTTVPATPVVTSTDQLAVVPVQASAVVAAAAPAEPVAGRAVKVEVLQDTDRVKVAGVLQSTAADDEVIVIDISDDESVGASAGMGCELKGGGVLQQHGDSRSKGGGMRVVRVKNELDADCGAAAAGVPVVARAASGVGALAPVAAVREQGVGDQRVSGIPTAVTAGPRDEGGEDQNAFGEVSRGGKHGKDGPTPAGLSGGLSKGVAAPPASTSLPTVAARDAGGGEGRQACGLGYAKSMAAVVNSPTAAAAVAVNGPAALANGPAAAAIPQLNVHQLSLTKAAAPGVAVATPPARGNGLEVEAVDPAGSGGTSTQHLVGRGAAAGEELAGAVGGAAASSPPLLAERQPSAGAAEVVAGEGSGGKKIAASGAARAVSVGEVGVAGVHGAPAMPTVGNGVAVAKRTAGLTLPAAIAVQNSAYDPATATKSLAAGAAIAPAPGRPLAGYKAAAAASMAAAPAARVMGKGDYKGCFWSAGGTMQDHTNRCLDKAVPARGIKKELDGELTAITAGRGTAAAGAESGAPATAGGMARAAGTPADTIRLPTKAAAAAGVPLPTAAQPAAGGNSKTPVGAGGAGMSQGRAAAEAASPGTVASGSVVIVVGDVDSEQEQDTACNGRRGSDVAAAVEPVLDRLNRGPPAAHTSMGLSGGNGLVAAAGGSEAARAQQYEL